MGYRLSPKEDYEFNVIKNDNGGYEVNLPHQCDDWKVLGFETQEMGGYSNEGAVIDGIEVEGRYPAHPTDKEFAVKQMELFVKRAKEALEKLKELA